MLRASRAGRNGARPRSSIRIARKPFATYREVRRRPDARNRTELVRTPDVRVTAALPGSFLAMHDRGTCHAEWDRTDATGDSPSVRTSRWWDPFNRNRLKGARTIFGPPRPASTATAEKLADERRVRRPAKV